jgi:hypothetical protein
MATEYPVRIEVDNDTIVCNVTTGKVKGGNVQGSAGDAIHFTGNGVKFKLAFESFPTGGPDYPFVGSTPWPSPSSPALPEFRGVLKTVAPPKYYKYTVIVEGVPPLDPIIIVDK